MAQSQPAFSQNIVIQPVSLGPGQPVYPVGGATPVVYAYQTRPAPVVYKDYRSCQSKFTGVAQILVGIGLIVFNAVGIGLYSYGWAVISHGIWGGCEFIVTGSFGVAAARLKSKCPVITYMVLCILSTCVGTTVFALGIVGTVVSKDDCKRDYYSYYYYNYRNYYSLCGDNPDAVIAMNVLVMVLGLLGAGCALWGSIICCRSACCCTSNMPAAQPVQFVTNNGIPVIIMGNQLAGYPMNAGQIVTATTFPATSGPVITSSTYPANAGPILAASPYQLTPGQGIAAPAYNPTVGDIGTAPAYQTTVGRFATAPAYQATTEQMIAAPPYDAHLAQAVTAPPYEATTMYHGSGTSEEQHSTINLHQSAA